MSAGKVKLVCPECKRELNHHADKLVDPTTREEAAQMDAALGGLVEEMHTCPGCGKVESQRGS